MAAFSATQVSERQAILVGVKGAPLNIAKICRDLVAKDLGEAGWNKFLEKAQTRFDEWSFEYGTFDKKRFLDDKLITLAPRVTSGKGEALREFCSWLALYDQYQEQLPRYIREIREEDKEWITSQLSRFDWNSAAQKIKEKASR